jgi:hypothetical protein
MEHCNDLEHKINPPDLSSKDKKSMSSFSSEIEESKVETDEAYLKMQKEFL